MALSEVLSTEHLRQQLHRQNSSELHVLRNAAISERQINSRSDHQLFDIGMRDGRIAFISIAGSDAIGAPSTELSGRMVWPRFADIHTHLDKGHVLARTGAADGTLGSAISVISSDRAKHWTADDLRTRINFALQSAFHYGTALIRTHIDSHPGQWQVSWDVLEDIRHDWKGRIELQASSLVPIPLLRDPDYADELARRVAKAGGVFGAVLFNLPDLEPLLESVFRLAAKYGLKLDFHVDETGDPNSNTLLAVAKCALDYGGAFDILAGHCCSLSLLTDNERLRTLDAVQKAGIGIVSLPACNLYLQDRKGRDISPRWRGLTAFKEARAAGIDVALASDNTRDPFHLFGDLDMLDTFRLGVRSLHLDDPVERWIDTVAATPMKMAGVQPQALQPGAKADFIIFEGRTLSEVLARSEANRIVVSNGKALNTSLPPYADLDGIC